MGTDGNVSRAGGVERSWGGGGRWRVCKGKSGKEKSGKELVDRKAKCIGGVLYVEGGKHRFGAQYGEGSRQVTVGVGV